MQVIPVYSKANITTLDARSWEPACELTSGVPGLPINAILGFLHQTNCHILLVPSLRNELNKIIHTSSFYVYIKIMIISAFKFYPLKIRLCFLYPNVKNQPKCCTNGDM